MPLDRSDEQKLRLDLDPFEDESGYYSEVGDMHFLVDDALESLEQDYEETCSEVFRAMDRSDLGKSVQSSFSRIYAWAPYIEPEFFGEIERAAKEGSLTSERYAERISVALQTALRDRAGDIVVSSCEGDCKGDCGCDGDCGDACQCKASTRKRKDLGFSDVLGSAMQKAAAGMWSQITEILEGENHRDVEVLDTPQEHEPTHFASVESAVERNFRRISSLYGPGGRFFVSSEDYLTKLEVWVQPIRVAADSKHKKELSELISEAKARLDRDTPEQPRVERLVEQMEEFKKELVGDYDEEYAESKIYRFKERAERLGISKLAKEVHYDSHGKDAVAEAHDLLEETMREIVLERAKEDPSESRLRDLKDTQWELQMILQVFETGADVDWEVLQEIEKRL